VENIWRVKNQSKFQKGDWLTSILAQNRGLTTSQKLKQFLNPTFEQITSVNIGKTEKAVERVESAIKNKEKIIVYSDYDADGISATAIMWETLNDLGANVMPYVPHRVLEGYGLFTPAIEELAKGGVKLIITVDHGVTAVNQIEAANKMGVDVIITDHHVLPAKLPQSFSLIHTTELCGAAVAWRLCWDIVKKIKPSYQKTLEDKLELAALATIADLVPLVGANRAIVKIGLEKIQKTTRPGIKSLILASGVTNRIGTYEIGHVLAPRINAMGRIEHGLDALRLICSRNKSQAERLTKLLTQTNSRRQDLTAKAIDHAMSLVDGDHLVGVVAHKDWHEGIIGLVASRLVEIHRRPMIVISKGVEKSKGSARSIAGFNIVEAIRASSEFLVDAGGHPMAAGFTIETRHIESFTRKINIYAQAKITEEILAPVVEIECELPKDQINSRTHEIIKKFEPYGVANPIPLFVTKNMFLEDVRTVGSDNRHLKLQVDGFSAIGFGKGEQKAQLRPGYKIDLVYAIEQDNFNGKGSLQLKIKDMAIVTN